MPNPPYPIGNPFLPIVTPKVTVDPNVIGTEMVGDQMYEIIDSSGVPNIDVSTPEKELYYDMTYPPITEMRPPSSDPVQMDANKILMKNVYLPSAQEPNVFPENDYIDKFRLPTGDNPYVMPPVPYTEEVKLPTVDVPSFTNTTFPTEKPTENKTVDTIQKNKMGIPEAYYLGKAGLDATALINNMIQPQPPSLQMKRPFFERMRMDREPYDTMRTNVREQGTQAMRYMRENVSQASDLMKGITAMTSATQQGLKDVGMQEAAQMQQIDTMNQQIASQESQAQSQLLNQEAATNYQIQQQAQQYKDSMISAQLSRLGDTAGAYAAYVKSKETADKLTNLSKEQTNIANSIQLAMLKYQAGENELSSDVYKEAENADLNQYITETKENLLSDPKYSSIKEKFPDGYDPLKFPIREEERRKDEMRMKTVAESFDNFKNPPQEPTRTDETEEQWEGIQRDYENKKAEFDMYEASYKKLAAKLEEDKALYDLEKSFYEDLKGQYNTAGRRQDFRSTWMQKRGLSEMKDVIAEVQSLIESSRQI